MKKIFLALSLVLLFTPVRLLQAESLEEEFSSAVPATEIQALAQVALKDLAQAYQTRSLDSFMELVSEDFLSSDGKRKTDLETSLETDFEELYHTRINVTSVNQRMVTIFSRTTPL